MPSDKLLYDGLLGKLSFTFCEESFLLKIWWRACQEQPDGFTPINTRFLYTGPQCLWSAMQIMYY